LKQNLYISSFILFVLEFIFFGIQLLALYFLLRTSVY